MTYEFLGQYGNKIASLLNLSESGAAKLIPFEEKCHFEAISSYSRNKLVQQHRIERPLHFYMKLCHSISTEKKYKINYGIYNAYVAEKGLDESSPIYLSTPIQHQPQPNNQSVPRQLDPVYEGFIMAGLRASGLFDQVPNFVLSLADAILTVAQEGYIRAFLCGDIYQPDLATLTLGIFSLIEKQYSLKTSEEKTFDLSLEEMKKRAAQGVYDYAVTLYRKAQD